MFARLRPTRSQSRFAVLVAITALLLLAIPVQAAPSNWSTNAMFEAETGQPVEGSSSNLIRTENGLSMSIRTSDLTPRHTYTVWWIIFNHPDLCEDGLEGVYQCGPNDLLLLGDDPDAAGIVGYATGNVAGGSGKSGFGGHLKVGDTSGFIDRFIDEHAGLTNPLGAEVHLVVRDHGPLNPRWMPDQILTFAGGCDQSQLPPPLHLGVPGDFDCSDVQVTFHVAD